MVSAVPVNDCQSVLGSESRFGREDNIEFEQVGCGADRTTLALRMPILEVCGLHPCVEVLSGVPVRHNEPARFDFGRRSQKFESQETRLVIHGTESVLEPLQQFVSTLGGYGDCIDPYDGHVLMLLDLGLLHDDAR